MGLSCNCSLKSIHWYRLYLSDFWFFLFPGSTDIAGKQENYPQVGLSYSSIIPWFNKLPYMTGKKTQVDQPQGIGSSSTLFIAQEQRACTGYEFRPGKEVDKMQQPKDLYLVRPGIFGAAGLRHGETVRPIWTPLGIYLAWKKCHSVFFFGDGSSQSL